MRLPFEASELRDLARYDAAFHARREAWRSGVDWMHGVPPSDARRIYELYPLLFAPAFPPIAPERLGDLVVAGRLLAESIFVFDAVVDQPVDALTRAIAVCKGQSLQLEAVRALAALFPGESAFWDALRADLSAYFVAIQAERRAPIAELTDDGALAIARGKTAVARSCLAALGELAGRRDVAALLADAVSDFYVARQLWDDLADWRTDLAEGQRSLVLARAARSVPPALATSAHAIGATIYYGGHAEHTLELGLEALARARAALARVERELPFGRLIDDLASQLAETRRDLAAAIARKRGARGGDEPAGARPLPLPARPPAGSPELALCDDVLWSAAAALAVEAPRAFGEARHWVRFPDTLGLQSRLFQSGDVFQRAVIADALCDLPPPLAASFAPVIAHEARYALASRVCARCGWSYLTDLAEEPADADTLAQVLQLAIRAGGAERAAFDAPIHLALSAGGHPDGSFETWILPPVPEREPLHDRQAQLVARAWGDGPDPEVMANLLYALALWAPARFAGPIERGARFLLARQRDTGAWGASWYWGPFYSTYAHVRLLARVASPEATAAVARAAAALLEGQGPRGDWSYRDVPRALDTAHAILALLAAEPVVPALQRPLRDAITRGLAALRSAQLPDGTWPADDFIRMDCGRAQRAAGRELAFGSRTLTAAYVLKAAATARRALGAVA